MLNFKMCKIYLTIERKYAMTLCQPNKRSIQIMLTEHLFGLNRTGVRWKILGEGGRNPYRTAEGRSNGESARTAEHSSNGEGMTTLYYIRGLGEQINLLNPLDICKVYVIRCIHSKRHKHNKSNI